MLPRHLIIVEDNEDDFEAVSRALRTVGVESNIEWYKNGKDALSYMDSLVQKKSNDDFPHLIILDLNIPGIDGRKMLGTIKQNPEIRSIPVIIFSTSADMEDIAHCYANGANTYIQKPLTFSKLKEVCHSIKNYWFDTAAI